MKENKIVSLIVIFLLLVVVPVVAFAINLDVPNPIPKDDNERLSSVQPEAVVTLLSTANAVSNGTGVDLGLTVSRFTCQMWRNGTASMTVFLQGNINGTTSTFANISSSHAVTSDLDTTIFHVVDKAVRYLRGRCATGCDVTNVVTMKCGAGGN